LIAPEKTQVFKDKTLKIAKKSTPSASQKVIFLKGVGKKCFNPLG
jgi:hypothetical protein